MPRAPTLSISFLERSRLPVAGADAGRPRQEWYYLQTPVSAAFAYQGADDGFVPLPVSGSQMFVPLFSLP